MGVLNDYSFVIWIKKKKNRSYNSINQERKIILTFPLYQINLFSLITIMNFFYGCILKLHFILKII
jgi:hypothetical protein